MPFIHLFTASALRGWAVLLLPVTAVWIGIRWLGARSRRDASAVTADRVAFELAAAGLLGSDAVETVMRRASCRRATAVAAVDRALEGVGPRRAYWNCPEHWPEWRPHLLVRFAPDDVDPDDVFAMNITFDRIDGDPSP